MLRKFAFIAESFLFLSFIACGGGETTAGGTIDPNTFAEMSSSSEMISSSTVPDESRSCSSKDDPEKVLSSSSENGGAHTPQIESSSSMERIRDVSSSSLNDGRGLDPIPVSSSSWNDDVINPSSPLVQCVGNVYALNRDASDGETDVGSPSAYKIVEKDWVQVVLSNVGLEVPCDASRRELFLKMLSSGSHIQVNLEGDTLYVADSRSDESRGNESTYGCVCAARVEFILDKWYSDFDYTVFNRKDAFPVDDSTSVPEKPQQNKQEGGVI